MCRRCSLNVTIGSATSGTSGMKLFVCMTQSVGGHLSHIGSQVEQGTSVILARVYTSSQGRAHRAAFPLQIFTRDENDQVGLLLVPRHMVTDSHSKIGAPRKKLIATQFTNTVRNAATEILRREPAIPQES